eukprot:993325-Amphidinium_carterae.2
MDNGTINLSFSRRNLAPQYFNKILQAYNLEKRKPSTVPGNKKPTIAAEPLDKEEHSMYRTAIAVQRVSQLRADIAFAVKELSSESFSDCDWEGCNATRKSTSGTITSCWGTPLLHISRTQSTITLSSAEAELYAMGQATIEAQHVKQAIEEMTIPNISSHVTMSINTDSSAG